MSIIIMMPCMVDSGCTGLSDFCFRMLSYCTAERTEMKQIRCWEYMKCGRQPGGRRVEQLGKCPAASFTQTECWLIAGTLCNGEVQGTYAQKYETCIVCDYYNKMQEYKAKRPRSGFLLFGQYLCNQGIITNDQIIQARSLQIRNNQKIGVLAKNRGLLTDEEIQRIMIIQEETLKRFGVLAVELGFLSDSQVSELVLEQEDNYLFFGEALVQLGAITQEEMCRHLKTFNMVKFGKQFKKS